MNKARMIMVFCGMSWFLLSCGSGNNNPITKAKELMKQASETVDVVKKVSDSQSIIQESVNRMEELQKIPPASKEDLKAWLPERVDDFKRKSYSTGDQGLGNISAISASFSLENEENKKFDLSVIDGAGETGGIFALVYLGQFNRDFEEEHQDGYARSVEKNNKRAVVSYDNRFNTSELEYVEGQRFYIKISGDNMNIDELWEIASKLKTNKLVDL